MEKLYPARQKLSIKGSKSALPSEAKLVDVGIKDGGELCVKDMGPQISWRTVFLIEYVRCYYIYAFAITVVMLILRAMEGRTVVYTPTYISFPQALLRA